MNQPVHKYGFIDAIRGYAVLGVILVHSSQFVTPTSAFLKTVASYGARGVELFFIASALTLCLSWNARKVIEGNPVRNFFIRRFFRIAPMFYVAIVFYTFLYGLSARYWAPNGLEWWFIPITVLFLNGFNPETINSVVPGGWSVAVEVSFYVILPLILRYLKTSKSFLIFFLLSLLVYLSSKILIPYFLLSRYTYEQQHLVYEFSWMGIWGELPIFALGLLTYSVFKSASTIKTVLAKGALSYLVFICFCFLLPVDFRDRLLSNFIVVGFGLALFTLFLSAYPKSIFVNNPMMFLGKISFSLYLVHFSILELFLKLGLTAFFQAGNLCSTLYYLCVIAVSAPLSYLFYNVVEKKGILLGSYIIDKLNNKSLQLFRSDL